jgi:hypothetical protein
VIDIVEIDCSKNASFWNSCTTNKSETNYSWRPGAIAAPGLKVVTPATGLLIEGATVREFSDISRNTCPSISRKNQFARPIAYNFFPRIRFGRWGIFNVISKGLDWPAFWAPGCLVGRRHHNAVWLFRCDCGSEAAASISNVIHKDLPTRSWRLCFGSRTEMKNPRSERNAPRVPTAAGL